MSLRCYLLKLSDLDVHSIQVFQSRSVCGLLSASNSLFARALGSSLRLAEMSRVALCID